MDNTKEIYLLLAMLGTLATMATVYLMGIQIFSPPDNTYSWTYGENETKIF